MTSAQPTVHDEPDAGRFTLRLRDEVVGFADYSLGGDVITIPHVETVPAHRGQGYAALLMDGVVASLRTNGQRLRPVCWYAAEYVRDRPATHDLVAS
jgi:predicted GNAT family acetyltransferase